MNRFDRYLLRAVGILILLAVLAGCGVIGYGLIRWVFNVNEPPARRDVVTVNAATNEKEFLDLGQPQVIKGTNYTMSQLRPTDDRRKFSSSYDYGHNRSKNVYFTSLVSGEGHWLLSGNNQTIARHRTLIQKADERHKNITIGHCFQIITQDTNGDGELDDEDMLTVYLSDPVGRNLTAVLEDVEYVIGMEQAGSDLLVVMAQLADGDYTYLIDIPAKSVKAKRKIDYSR